MLRPFVLLSIFLLVGIPIANAKRVALVIGNAAYEHVPSLANPRNDADAVSASLERLDFEVIKGVDLSRLEFEEKVREFGRATRGAEIALLYYAGHGLQVDGKNYLAPTDTQLFDETDLDFEAIQLNTIMAVMERGAQTNLVFLDACRNNPLARDLARSMGTRSALVGRGLASVETGIGTLVTFATQPGNVALDGDGDNSPFTEAFINHIETPDEDVAVILRRVRKEVIDQTAGKQVPWGNSSLTGSVVLNSTSANTSADRNDDSVELAYWNSIKDSNSPVYFKNYLSRFPDGQFADIAEVRISEFGKSDAADAEQNDVLIAKLEQPSLPNVDAENPKLNRELVASIQKELNRTGCSVGSPDGIWGNRTERGLKDFAGNSGIELSSLDPSAKLLDLIKGMRDKVCGFALEGYNGYWRVKVVTTTPKQCGWNEKSFAVRLADGSVSGGVGSRYWDGSVSPDGILRMRRHFPYQGQKMFNILSGRINGDAGSGIMQHGQGNCRGRFTISRL